MLKLNPQGPQEIRKYPQAAAGHLKDIREKNYKARRKLVYIEILPLCDNFNVLNNPPPAGNCDFLRALRGY